VERIGWEGWKGKELPEVFKLKFMEVKPRYHIHLTWKIGEEGLSQPSNI
jgi:hypothetical protein